MNPRVGLMLLTGGFLALAGCDRAEANRISTHLLGANLAGHDSHGVVRVPRYASQKKGGTVLPDVTVDVVVEMSVFNPFDFFLEPGAEHFPFKYEPLVAQELAPYLAKAPLTPKLKLEYPCWCGAKKCRGTLLSSTSEFPKDEKSKVKKAEKPKSKPAKGDKKKAEKKSTRTAGKDTAKAKKR